MGGILGPREADPGRNAAAGLVGLGPRARTQKVSSPGLKVATPDARGINSQPGGRIDDTVTMFCCSMSASRREYSNAVRRCRWVPTPWVRKTHLGMGNIGRPQFRWIKASRPASAAG
jgi:hypothetical protein